MFGPYRVGIEYRSNMQHYILRMVRQTDLHVWRVRPMPSPPSSHAVHRAYLAPLIREKANCCVRNEEVCPCIGWSGLIGLWLGIIESARQLFYRNTRYSHINSKWYGMLALGCESNWVKSTHDAYENTWKCGELELYFLFCHIRRRMKAKKKKRCGMLVTYLRHVSGNTQHISSSFEYLQLGPPSTKWRSGYHAAREHDWVSKLSSISQLYVEDFYFLIKNCWSPHYTRVIALQYDFLDSAQQALQQAALTFILCYISNHFTQVMSSGGDSAGLFRMG